MENIETKEIRYSKAFKETYVIINNFAEELYFKIPKSFINLIKENMSKDYDITLEELEQNEKMPETKAILSLIYRDYLCDEETKKQLKEQDRIEIEEQNERYNNIFKDRKPKVKPETCTELIVVEEEKWYMKIWNKIKSLFTRKNK